MVTLQTADNALKTFYLDAVTEQIDNKISPFLAMIEKTSAYVAGKGVSKMVKTGMNSSVSAGTETGFLPRAKANQYITLNSTLKNLYGTIEISDKAIRASANNEGAFVNLLNDEMQSLIRGAKYNFSRMLFGDGTGKIATFLAAERNVVTVDNVNGLEEGMEVDLYMDGEAVYQARKIGAVDKANGKITLTNITDEEAEALVGCDITVAGTLLNGELTGLGAIFSDATLYGVSRDKSIMQPYQRSGVGALDESVVQKAIDAIEQRGGKVNLILCSRGVRRALLAYYRNNQLTYSMTKIGDDLSVITFNGIPVVVDDFCPAGTMYLLNTNDFKLCQLCDWEWLEGENGKILKQVADKPVYTATLVKYAELLCERPCGQGMLAGITEA